MKRIVSGIMLIMLLIGMLTLVFNINPVKASGTIYIRPDGSIDPPTAPISSVDSVTYVLTDNVNDGIVVERNNIVVDGAGYFVQGSTDTGLGVYLLEMHNVTIKNMTMATTFFINIAIALERSSNISIIANKITNNEFSFGIYLWQSSNNSVSKNSIEATTSTATHGIYIGESSNNNIVENDIKNNDIGLQIESSSNNTIYHNNFVNNKYYQVFSDQSVNTWDDGYPSGGNYWSDYAGVDANGDGIGDSPYVIDANNQDRYPLMHPWSSLPVHNINTGLGYATIQEAINAPETLNGHTIFTEIGIYYEDVIVNKSVSLIGENQDNTIIDGGGRGSAVSVSANHVLIANFAIINSSREWPGAGSGIRLEGVDDCIIRNNNIANNAIGISLSVSYNNFLFENKILNNWHGIWLDESSNNMVCGNNITANNGTGVWFRYSSDNSVSGNNITGSGSEGIFFYDSSDNSVSGNNVTNNSCGVWLYGSSTNSVSENNITSNREAGIVIGFSFDNTISSNNITNNRSGIHLGGSSNNFISKNKIANNCYEGIWQHSSSNNVFYHNNFINNTEQVWSYISTSIWDSGYPSGGNYWSDYVGVDVKSGPSQNLPGSDGLGDTPYTIDADNIDHYPLMNPYGAPPPPLSVSINPLSASIIVGQAVHFTSTVTGGTPPYIHKWYLNGITPPNATSIDYTFTPSGSGTYDIWKGVTDNSGTMMNSTHAQVTVAQKLSVSIIPAYEFTSVGESIAFIPSVSGGYTPYMYSYSWDLSLAKGTPYDPGDGHIGLYLTAMSAGTCHVYLNITDSKGNAAQSNIARITIVAPPVGGYSIPIEGYTTTQPITIYLTLIAILTIGFTTIRHKTTKRKTK